MTGVPGVSVVIPTYQRPDLVLRAVRSALGQTLTDLEVIVVVDGRDVATCQALDSLQDLRVRIHVPDRHLGNADARNTGVALARAPWVAFLDDDDEWLPTKLECQFDVAERASAARPVVACRLVARSGSGDMTWPRRLPRPGEDWSEYFFCRRTPFTGEGIITTSVIFAPRALLLEVPFASGLTRHVDPDWLLRVLRQTGVAVEFVSTPEPLVIWHVEHDRTRITTQPDWRASYQWCRSNRALFSARGYAAFVLHVVGSNAARARAWRAFPMLLSEAWVSGRPAVVDVASHVANFLLPSAVQRRAALWYARVATRR